MTRASDLRPTGRPGDFVSGTEPEPGDFPDGADETLILWFLGLTPLERLQWAQDMADAVTELRGSREL